MVLARTVLLLVLLAPCVGRAQSSEGPPSPGPADASELPSPPLVPAPEPTPQAEPPAGEVFPREPEAAAPAKGSFSVGRAMLEVLGGGAGGATVGFLSLLLGGLVFSPLCDTDECLGPILITGIVGTTFGVPLGVYGAGKLAGGKGKYWPAFVGTIMGGGLGLAAALLSQDEAGTAIGLTAGPVIGAVIGYELSHSLESAPAAVTPQGSSPGLMIFPTFGLTLTGGVVGGLSGRF
jgi:hypothetical protein